MAARQKLDCRAAFIFTRSDFINVGGNVQRLISSESPMAERVFKILTQLSKNLTDRADKSFAGTVREKNSSGRMHSSSGRCPVNKFVD